MKKGALIGKGRSAEVYEWGESQALKLYYEGYRPEWVTYEAEMGRIVAEAGSPPLRSLTWWILKDVRGWCMNELRDRRCCGRFNRHRFS